jgi:arabinoxylan arabinofuranohydrolase
MRTLNVKWRLALLVGFLAQLPTPARADNPIVQTNYTADPAPMVHDGKVYLYTSHDEDVTVNNFYTMNDWKLYSTEDMVNWTDLGTPAAGNTFSWFTDNAWAPQGIFRNDKYYLYVPLNNNTGAKIGVGVSDNVEGPFMDPLGGQLASMGSGNIDPTVFIDDDDQAYMYWGGASTLRYVRLNENMTSYSGGITTVAMPGFTEGPWFYKRESLYYLVFAATSGTEKISYATSNSPTGPWTVRGDIMPPGNTFTNHAGIVDYKGHSYFFYHNSALPGGNDFRRSVCVEEFTYGNDGTIPAIPKTNEGPDPVATLNPFQQVEAETIAFSSGLKTEKCMDTGGGMNVTSISANDYIKVRNIDFLEGVTSFEARVSSSGANVAIELHLDSRTGPLLGTCDVSGTSSWTTKTCTVTGGSGIHDLFLTFTGSGDNLFKFNWWKFDGPMPPDGTGGASGAGGGASAGGDSGAGGAASGGANAGLGGTTTSGGGPGAGGAISNVGGSGGQGLSSGGAPGAGGISAGGTASSSGGTSVSVGGSSIGGQVDGETPGSTASGCACRVGAQKGPNAITSSLGLMACALALGRRRRKVRNHLAADPLAPRPADLGC